MPGISQEERNRLSPVWDMSQERVYMATMMAQRFNFFLLFFSLVVAGALNARSQDHFRIVLTLGAIIAGLLALSIARVQGRLIQVMAEIAKDPTHPHNVIPKQSRWLRVRWLIGYGIPSLCVTALVVGAVLSWLSILMVAPRP